MWYNFCMKILLSRRGFTLIEMAIVLVIILAFLAMSIPFFANFSGSTGMNTANREVTTLLRTARSYAVSQNANFNAVFDTAVTPNTYRITNNAGTTLDKTYVLPNGVSFTATTTITFTPNGGLTSTSPTAVTIRNNKNPDRTINLNSTTGAIQ